MLARDLMSREFLKLSKDDSVSKFFGMVERAKRYPEAEALVFEGKKFIGIASKKWMLKTKIDPSKMKVRHIVHSVPKLKGDEPVAEVARLLYTADVHILPVMKRGIVQGVVRSLDVIKVLKKMPRFARLKASTIMSTELHTIHAKDRVGKALEMMREERIHHIPIVDSKGELLDLVSFTDFMQFYLIKMQGSGEYGHRGSAIHQKSDMRTKAAEAEKCDMHGFLSMNITSPILITASPDDSVSRIIDLMEEFRISNIVLVRKRKPVGIVTIRDLLKLFLSGLVKK